MSIRRTPWMVALPATITGALSLGAGWATSSLLIGLAVAGSASCGVIAGLLIGIEATVAGFKPKADGARAEIAQQGEALTAAHTRIAELGTELARTQQQWEQAADLAESHLSRLHAAEARLAEASR